jgi:hypothetical protein
MLTNNPSHTELRALAELAAGRDYGVGDVQKKRLTAMGLLEQARYPSPSVTSRGRQCLARMGLVLACSACGSSAVGLTSDATCCADVHTLDVAGDEPDVVTESAPPDAYDEPLDAPADVSDAPSDVEPLDTCCAPPDVHDEPLDAPSDVEPLDTCCAPPDVHDEPLDAPSDVEPPDAPADVELLDAGEISDACPTMLMCEACNDAGGCQGGGLSVGDPREQNWHCVPATGTQCGFGCTLGGTCTDSITADGAPLLGIIEVW